MIHLSISTTFGLANSEIISDFKLSIFGLANFEIISVFKFSTFGLAHTELISAGWKDRK